MRMYYVIGVLITLFLASCGEPPMPPSDEEMIRHFATHEAAFRKVYEIMSRVQKVVFTTRRFLRKRLLYLIQ